LLRRLLALARQPRGQGQRGGGTAAQTRRPSTATGALQLHINRVGGALPSWVAGCGAASIRRPTSTGCRARLLGRLLLLLLREASNTRHVRRQASWAPEVHGHAQPADVAHPCAWEGMMRVQRRHARHLRHPDAVHAHAQTERAHARQAQGVSVRGVTVLLKECVLGLHLPAATAAPVLAPGVGHQHPTDALCELALALLELRVVVRALVVAGGPAEAVQVQLALETGEVVVCSR
jgi:hypothetical protein